MPYLYFKCVIRSNNPPVELLDTLDNIRTNFRNPTNHPEKIFEIDKVQDLIFLCVDSINRMVKNRLLDNSYVSTAIVEELYFRGYLMPRLSRL
jgi:hypothetical protein